MTRLICNLGCMLLTTLKVMQGMLLKMCLRDRVLSSSSPIPDRAPSELDMVWTIIGQRSIFELTNSLNRTLVKPGREEWKHHFRL